MAKDKSTPKNKTPHRQEAKPKESFIEISDEATALSTVSTSAEFQETFSKLNNDCSQWAIKQSELWEKRMVEHRDQIIENINNAIQEKIQPKINDIDQFILNLESEFKKHKHEAQASSQAIFVVKDLQKNMSTAMVGFNTRFERLAQINKENNNTIALFSHKLEATEAHLTCFSSRMDVLDESLEEHEKRWMDWESGNSLVTHVTEIGNTMSYAQRQ